MPPKRAASKPPAPSKPAAPKAASGSKAPTATPSPRKPSAAPAPVAPKPKLTPKPPAAAASPPSRSRASIPSRSGVGGGRGSPGKKVGSPRFPLVVVDPRLVPVKRELALEVGLVEVEARALIAQEEQAGRIDKISALMKKISLSGFQEKCQALLLSATQAMEPIRKEEEAAREGINKLFVSEKARVTKIDLGELEAEEFGTLLDKEFSQRKKMEYLEDRTFKDMVLLEKSLRNNRNEDERIAAIRRQNEGLHCVRLFDGCPFIDPRHCPFHSVGWVDPVSLRQQHFFRKYPRLKYNRQAVEKSYQDILSKRYAKIANMDCRLFVSRMEHGLAPETK